MNGWGNEVECNLACAVYFWTLGFLVWVSSNTGESATPPKKNSHSQLMKKRVKGASLSVG